jgi:hypothetical protein
MTKLLFCGCEHKFQDERYGVHIRVCNGKKPKQGTVPTEFRCTVCGAVK